MKAKCVTLTPGRYIYVCPCGGRYRVMDVPRINHKVGVYCFYCKQQIGKHYRIMDERLEFAQNWNNKLGCSCFTTIRLHNPRKYCAGARMNIYLKDYWKGSATVLQVETATLGNINERIARQDTDLPAEEFRRLIRSMYKNRPGINWETQQLDIILLRYDKESKEPKLNL